MSSLYPATEATRKRKANKVMSDISHEIEVSNLGACNVLTIIRVAHMVFGFALPASNHPSDDKNTSDGS